MKLVETGQIWYGVVELAETEVCQFLDKHFLKVLPSTWQIIMRVPQYYLNYLPTLLSFWAVIVITTTALKGEN